ncbi:hypothetical protein [Hoeflea prorocentri]|uniref:DUF2147 domain-containing protein n=1 Tax=Hoeflea prorocentri TaxID=1922333 RepID=A0A9X3UHQ8_9HYPH|nr:hypothetical protein [Hoeflea prorocentri]MCY6381557.1 hypothetical protein [Hoeflea prorocentri]MDA5399357.1 hypothetical protein [Hoeflea prorocentri]
MKRFAALLFGIVLTGPSLAKDAKFVGVWEGDYETPIYTKIVLKDDQSLTYCEVSHCRQVNCMEMAYTGSFASKFEYQDALGKWEFVRISEDEFEGTYTHVEGDVSTAYYEPE